MLTSLGDRITQGLFYARERSWYCIIPHFLVALYLLTSLPKFSQRLHLAFLSSFALLMLCFKTILDKENVRVRKLQKFDSCLKVEVKEKCLEIVMTLVFSILLNQSTKSI